MSPWCFKGKFLPSSFHLENLEILSYVNFLIALCTERFLILLWGVNYMNESFKTQRRQWI